MRSGSEGQGGDLNQLHASIPKQILGTAIAFLVASEWNYDNQVVLGHMKHAFPLFATVLPYGCLIDSR